VENRKEPRGASLPTAVVMNMFYTGLGIARSLGERGVPVLGLSGPQRGCGNHTRYARTVLCPDSREEPEALAAFLIRLGRQLKQRAVVFPTRDDDLVFLNRFRKELEVYFNLVVPDTAPLQGCLDKWQTAEWAERAGVASPKYWVLRQREDIDAVAKQIAYPCVLKPLSAHYWRHGANWRIVGSRKAIEIQSEAELRREYLAIAEADERALLQELIPGGDNNLVIAACYMDRGARWVAGFNTRKLVQVPERFGTGCIVESVDTPELFDPAERILRAMGFRGIAEVEFKWDERDRKFKLIEINPRAWDQHRLGNAGGIDLIYMAYCDHAGLELPHPGRALTGHKWIAEDTFLTTALRMLWRRDPRFYSLFRQARGKRIYAVWNWKDPLPALALWLGEFLPQLLAGAVRRVVDGCKRAVAQEMHQKGGSLAYEASTNGRKNRN
jgi:D-aspartate ligase